MKLLKRNLRPISYALYKRKTEITDEDGYEAGENDLEYFAPVELKCNVSPAKGYTQTELFGDLESYDKVIVTDDMSCPIDEQTILFVDRRPLQDPLTKMYLHDYIVRRVAKSLNFIAYAISHVTVSHKVTPTILAVDSTGVYAVDSTGVYARAWDL